MADIMPSMGHWKQMCRALFDWYRQEEPDEEKVSNEAIWRKVRKQMAHNFPKAQFVRNDDALTQRQEASLAAKN